MIIQYKLTVRFRFVICTLQVCEDLVLTSMCLAQVLLIAALEDIRFWCSCCSFDFFFRPCLEELRRGRELNEPSSNTVYSSQFQYLFLSLYSHYFWPLSNALYAFNQLLTCQSSQKSVLHFFPHGLKVLCNDPVLCYVYIHLNRPAQYILHVS